MHSLASTSAPNRRHTLLTFDVDGTLVHGTGQAAAASVHARAFGYAFSKHFANGEPVTPVAEALPRRLYQGSTDGLILLRLAAATMGLAAQEVQPLLPILMQTMFDYVQAASDEELTEHIQVLPGVKEHFVTVASMQDKVSCGLVTGNVEGIARRKMYATGLWDTGALKSVAPSQTTVWQGTESFSFLGGFGSDYCSGDIENLDRNHLDRAAQIGICVERCRETTPYVTRVVHIGDAPADVLAAKAYRDEQAKDAALCVGMVAVATWRYQVDEFRA